MLDITPLKPDIEKIIHNKTSVISKRHIIAIIHTEKMDYYGANVISIDIVRDYEQAGSDYIALMVTIPSGDYLKKIHTNNPNMEITLMTTPLNLIDQDVNRDFKPYTVRYKAILSLDKNPQSPIGDAALSNQQDLNLGSYLDINFQLMEKSAEALRVKTVQGIYSEGTPESVLKAIYTTALTNTQIEGKTSTTVFQMASTDNQEVRKQLIVPPTLLTRVPELVNRHFGGVYNGFIGTYLQRYKNVPTMFLYPLYNKTLYKKEKRKIIFYQLPGSRMDDLQKTYRVDKDIVHAIVGSNSNITDLKTIKFNSTGPGFNMIDANKTGTETYATTPNGPSISKNQLLHRLKDDSVKDGTEYLRQSPIGPHSNMYMEVGEMMKKNALIVDLIWTHSYSDLIYPGLPCAYKTIKSGKVFTLIGTIINVHTLIQKTSTVRVEHSFYESCAIRMALYEE